ncbi:hypothetical protein [Shimia sp. Alg240-R146]|uniref:hypothetical protein n=1 Tax=Shimia sp. Alg240-R146 TaxID=2993449 RepID=UPI0022E28060|nr:hypothetical protein [Shimia sp. Alg240-R146]
MLIFFEQSLALFAVPKTGSTAFGHVLRPFADISFQKRVKHLTVGKYHRRVAPMLDRTFDLRPDRVAVMRDPIEQLRSWYRFRARSESTALSTQNMSFDTFVLDVISEHPSPVARVGTQVNFLSLKDKSVPVHHLFAYDRQPLLRQWLSERFGEDITPKPRNVSPYFDAPLSPEVEIKLRKARGREFALYDQIVQAGGVLRDHAG